MSSKIYQNLIYSLLIFILFFISIFLINHYVISFSQKFIYKNNSFLKDRIGLVLGAGIKNNSYPSHILKDRLDSSIEAYNSGIISKIIVSGDNSKVNHNEPAVMKNYLISKGIPKDIIFKDHAGFDTYDSIYRSKYIFGVQKILIFTQEYHLYRALYISNKLGMDSYGFITDKHFYNGIINFKTRELLSRVKAFLEIEIFKPKPKFLGDKININ